MALFPTDHDRFFRREFHESVNGVASNESGLMIVLLVEGCVTDREKNRVYQKRMKLVDEEYLKFRRFRGMIEAD